MSGLSHRIGSSLGALYPGDHGKGPGNPHAPPAIVSNGNEVTHWPRYFLCDRD